MTTTLLEVAEGLQTQSSGESIAYTIEVKDYPGSGNPSSLSAKVFDTSDDSDVTSTVMSTGSISSSGTVITLQPLDTLIKGKTYRIQVKFTRSTNIFEPFFNVLCPY